MELIGQARETRNRSWEDANQEVDRLEHTARLLPNDISAYGVMAVPVAAPAVTVEPQVDVHPDVQVTVEANQPDAYADGWQEQAALTGSAPILAAGEKGREA